MTYSKKSSSCRIVSALCLGLIALSVTACSSDPPASSFAPLHYEYLNRMHLNAASLSIQDNAVPGGLAGDIASKAPTPPDQALVRMAQDRIIASGRDNKLLFTVQRAAIFHAPGGVLNGQMATRLDLLGPSGNKLGFAEAHVERNYRPDESKGSADSRKNLYEMVNQMMQDMNAELEFQIKKSLGNWMVDAGGMPLNGSIQQEDLGRPQAPAPVAASHNAATTPAPKPAPSPAGAISVTPSRPRTSPGVPSAIFPTGADAPDADTSTEAARPRRPLIMSPPPGVLRLPPQARPGGY